MRCCTVHGSPGSSIGANNLPMRAYVAERIASSISPDTSTGLDAREAWLAGSVITLRALMRFVMKASVSGLIMRSSLET